jgi:hypothetical protein
MKTYGTLRAFLEKYNPPLHTVIIHTSDYYIFGGSEREIEHLLDNEMYEEPQFTAKGNWYVWVQD